MSRPTYDEFVKADLPFLAREWRAVTGQPQPGASDYAHFAQRLLIEGWLALDAALDIRTGTVGGAGKREGYPAIPYDPFVKTDYPAVIAAYVQRHGQQPGDSDFAHLAWRVIVERWTTRDMIHSIRDEPLEDGGAGGAGAGQPGGGGTTFMGRIGIAGRLMTAGGQTYRPAGVSAFTLPKLWFEGKRTQVEDYVGWMVARRLDLGRMFLAGTGWNALRAADALAVLPEVLAYLKSVGVYAESTVITGSSNFADQGFTAWESVVKAAGLVASAAENSTIEIANEFPHGSQSSQVHDTANLRKWGRGLTAPWAIGAAKGGRGTPESPDTDEPLVGFGYPGAGGTYATSHLNRGRPYWEQVRRVREIFAIYEGTRAPAWDNERIGAAKDYIAGKRMNDPVFFLTAGVLNRCFETPSVHHTDSGLLCTVPVAVETACADAFVRGLRDVVPDQRELFYRNSGHEGSPVKSFTGATRCYSFIAGGKGVTVVVGGSDATKIQWGSDYKSVDVLCNEQAKGPGSNNARLIVHRVER